MKTSEKTDKLFPLLLKVKSELGNVTKSAANPFFKSKYADLNTHLDVVEPVLEKHGLMLLQPVEGSTVESLIVHAESGQWLSSSMTLILAKQSMQDAGSAVSYARRYTLGALLSMKAVDDDGEVATGRSPSPYKTATASKVNSNDLPKVAPPQETFQVKATVTSVTNPGPISQLTPTPNIAAVQANQAKKSTFRKPTEKAADAPIAGGNGWE